MSYKEKARELVAQMTLEEKASLTSGLNFWYLKGISRLGLPSVMVTDGPHGLRKQTGAGDNLGIKESVPAVCFPTAAATGCSFDRELLRRIGAALGEECRQEDVAVILGPGVNIKRSPLCGRNFEYFSEDPYLSGELGAALVNGVQSGGVGVSVKHYAFNNQETCRMTSDSVVDERAAREIYLAAFETVAKNAQPWTFMCSYNRFEGTYCSENEKLLTGILRGEWGFDGLVMSDWGAVSDRVRGIAAGLDLQMPADGGGNDRKVVAAVKDGVLPETQLDAAAVNVAELILKSKDRAPFRYDVEAHRALAAQAAAASTVLLKNEGDILPMPPKTSFALIGAFAKTPRYQGAGSSKIVPVRIDSAYDCLIESGAQFDYADGYDLKSGKPDKALIADATEKAKGKGVVFVIAGLPDSYESEGFDRTSMKMPDAHNELIEAVASVNPNTVVLLAGGAPMEIPWENSVKGILMCYLGGEAGGRAIAGIISGKTTPGGRLAESWPFTAGDNPSAPYFPGYKKTVEYRESIFIGYRYYDAAGAKVRYPFGHGLSYTTFEYGEPKLDKTSIEYSETKLDKTPIEDNEPKLDKTPIEDNEPKLDKTPMEDNEPKLDKTPMEDNETLTASIEVKNTGKTAGYETVQLYVAHKNPAVFKAEQELKGFEKVFLAPGESRNLSFSLGKRAFAYYNTATTDWHVESGEYEIRFGASSRDIRQRVSINVVTAVSAPVPDYHNEAPGYYDIGRSIADIPDEEFVALLGRPLPPRMRDTGAPFDENSTFGDIKVKWFGRLFARIVKKQAAKALSGSADDIKAMLDSMFDDMPLRGVLAMAGDRASPNLLYGLLTALNGRFFKGFRRMLRA